MRTSDHPAAWGETADNQALKLRVGRRVDRVDGAVSACQEPPNAQRPAPPLAPKCEACGAKAARTYYCRAHDVVLCGGCAWSRHSTCQVWRLIEEAPEMDADEQMRDGAKRIARESSDRWMRARADDARQEMLRRRIRVAWLAVVAGLVAFAIAVAGCSSSVPDIVRDRAPAARRAAELYVERTMPLLGGPRGASLASDDGGVTNPATFPTNSDRDLTEEERAETRALGEALLRYLREMEAATR